LKISCEECLQRDVGSLTLISPQMTSNTEILLEKVLFSCSVGVKFTRVQRAWDPLQSFKEVVLREHFMGPGKGGETSWSFVFLSNWCEWVLTQPVKPD